jgi:hypothetical protein
MHTNGAHKNNNITPICIVLNKTTQKHRRCKKKVVQEKIKSHVLKQMYFNVNDESAIILEYFNLRTISVAVTTSEQLSADGKVRPKHAAV